VVVEATYGWYWAAATLAAAGAEVHLPHLVAAACLLAAWYLFTRRDLAA
jgi:hypothetical protein